MRHTGTFAPGGSPRRAWRAQDGVRGLVFALMIVIKNAFWLSVCRFTADFSSLVLFTFISRDLGPASTGEYSYAFALGALAHFAADNSGHRIATNISVPLLYPKLRLKYGNSITYADDHVSHSRTEFAFDVFQASKGRYASEGYKDFVGFQVSKRVLEQAFLDTYGMKLESVFLNVDLAIGSYRWAISRLIPQMTTVSLQFHKKELVNESPSFEKKRFLYRLSRTDYEKSWGTNYQRPGFGTRFLAALLRIFPKVGPFKGLDFNDPTKTTEDLYVKSINKTFDDYKRLLMTARTQIPDLTNRDLDSGEVTRPAEYTLADDTYEKLLTQLADEKFTQTTPELRDNILRFYSDQSAPLNTKKDEAKWQHVRSALDQLKAAPPAVASASSPAK